jgi:microcystin-dependent protein
MPDTYTDNLGLVLPEVGASRDSWGAKLSSNFETLDEFVSMAMPVGVVADFAGPNPPPGWLACDGRQVSRTTYSQLFAAIGTAWGNGDGSTTFNLPPANGRAAIGAGTVTDTNGISRAYTFASRTGTLTYTLKQVNLPNFTLYSDPTGDHSHGGVSGASGSHAHTTDMQGVHSHDTGGTGFGTTSAGDHMHAGGTDAQGNHTHTVGLWNLGTGAAAGGTGIVSDAFGATSYTTSVNGAHIHSITTNTAGGHAHNLYWDGSHAHTTTLVANHQHSINTDGNHAHTIWSGGSGTPFDMVPPVMVVSKIIYAGSQAAPAAATAAVPLVRRLMSAPMRGTH